MSRRTDRKGLIRGVWDRARGRVPRHGSSAHRGDWRSTVRGRVLVAGVAFGVWTVGIEARLVYLQIVQHDELQARADGQHGRSITVQPKRGEILDRNGQVLAYSVDADAIYAVPKEIEAPARMVANLCVALDDCTDNFRKALDARLRSQKAFAFVDRQVSLEQARRVAELGLQGIGFLPQNRRYYPNRELAAHVLGYVGIDNQGLGGIEWAYDEDISGSPGQVLIQTDAKHRAFSRIERPPTAGATLELTIDKYLQHIAERELRAGVDAYNADAGAVVILDPNTGEVLALANQPTFNPNAFSDATPAQKRNRAIQDIYEPGSTFKVVTASAAFEEKVVRHDEIFDVSAGAIRIGRDLIPDFHVYDQLSFTDVMVKSSNVGVIRVGLRLGPERLSRYVRRFGFGQALSPDFPSENPGIVWNPAKLNDRALASIAMGYQVAVTPLQMAAAVATVANGGELIAPRIVRAITQNGARETSERRVIRRAISIDTAAELTKIMEAVVARGTGRRAQVPGYTVAGKTGTAEKLIEGQYSSYDHNASFVGFVPSDRPRLVVLVMIDTPRSAVINGVRQRAYTGGMVAAPIFQRIAEGALRHLAVPLNLHPDPPVLIEPTLSPAVPSPVFLSTPTSSGDGESVGPGHGGYGVMPDLRGLSARDAVEAVGQWGLQSRIIGTGVVTDHDPPPGAEIERGITTTMWLHRHAGLRDRESR